MGKINTDNYPNRPFSSYQDDDMFILQDNGGETYTTNVGDVKNLADSRIKLEGVQVNGTNLPITNKKVNVDISDKTDLSVIAYTFNSEMGYFKGAYVTYNGKLYEFIQEHTGAWNPSHVREIRASGQYVRTGNGGYNNGDRATCEGYMTKASGNYSHAEGRETQAVGECTHAEGRGTIANSIYQHVEGKYNIADNESKYIHIIGNGIDDNNRSNAMTLDWDGNLEVSGDVEDGNGEKISDKADKVTNATSGHLAGLDSNGNLTDSGVSPTEDVTVEGNPVTFDSPFEQDAKSVVVSVKPIQDLHGYDHPWVGGAGKNLWNTDSYLTSVDVASEVVVSKVSENVYHIVGTLTSPQWVHFVTNSYAPLTLPSDTYTVSIRNKTTGEYNSSVRFYFNDEATQHSDYATYTGAITQIRILLLNDYAYNDDITIQIEKGSSPTSFAPYSNECPISGIDELEIGVSGKNILPKMAAGSTTKSGITYTVNSDGSTNVNGTSGGYSDISIDVTDALKNFEGQTVFFSGNPSSNSTTNIRQCMIINGSVYFDYNEGVEITLPDKVETAVYLVAVAGTGTVASNILFKPQLELGSTATEYEPYKGSTTIIPLPSTLYDADVDVTEGSADSRKRFVVFDGSEDEGWNVFDNGNRVGSYFLASTIDRPLSSMDLIGIVCDKFSEVSSEATYVGNLGISVDTNGRILVADGTHAMTKESWVAYLAEHPLQVCYELATPTTLSFDPTNLELLEGTNVVTTNGEKVAVTYGRSLWQDINDLKTDTEGKLNKSDVATIEGDTASKAYSINDFMLRADGLYKVTAPIASGASITASNTTKTTVGEVLTALLNA